MMGALIDLTVKSTALLLGGALIVLIMRRATAASRHQVWAGVLCAVALLPITRLGLPALNVPVLEANVAGPTVGLMPIPDVAANPIVFERIEQPAAAQPVAQSPALPSLSLADAAAAIWLLGIVALAVRATSAHLALRRLTSRATNASDPRVLAILREAAEGFRVRRRIALLSHADDGLPCTFGVFRPVILIPTSLLAADSEGASRLRVVLTHETAHVARLDAISERITQVAVMLFWFNPIVWFAARQARFERERAADDAVLVGGTKPSDYATDLLAIARGQSARTFLGAVPMAVSSLERRVRAILDDRIRRGRYSPISAATTLMVLAAMLPVSAIRLVARSAPPSPSVQMEMPSALATAPPAPASSPGPTPAQVPPSVQKAEQSDLLAVWNTERERNLRQVLRRARAAHQEALTKVAIGTTAPIDVTVLEKAIAQLEEAVKNFTPTTTPLTAQELKSRRAVFGAFLSNLERAELRFTNGLLTTDELASVLLRTAQVIDPSVQAPAPTGGRSPLHTSPFAFRPEPSPTDPTRARELYSLLTGQVSFVHGAQADPATPWQHVPGPGGFVYITGEVKTPGKYPLDGPTTVLQLLTVAGGLLPSAEKNQIVLVSGTLKDKDGNPLTRSINYNDLMKGKNLKENNLELGPGDAVIVRSPGPGYYWQR